MRTVLYVLAALAAAATFAAPGRAQQQSGIFGCTKDTTIQGHFAIIFCGPAKATVHVGSHAATIRGGSCVRRFGRFALNVGISVANVKSPPNWLSVTTPARPRTGTQPASVGLFLGGNGYAIVAGTVTIAADGRHGSFAGRTGPTVYQNNVKVFGAFSC